MNIIWIIFELVINLIYSILFSEFIIRYFSYKNNIKCKSLFTLIIILIIFGTITLSNIFIVYDGIWSFVYIIELFVFSVIFLQGSIFEKLFISILEYGVFAIISAFILFLISFIYSMNTIEIMYLRQSSQRIVTIFSILIIYFFITRVILNIKNKFTNIKMTQWIFLSFVPLLSLMLMIGIIELTFIDVYNENFTMVFFLISLFSIFILNIIIYFFISIINKSNKIVVDNLLIQQFDHFKEQNIINFNDIYEKTKILQHDMKYHTEIIYLELEKINNNDVHINNIKSYLLEIQSNINNYSVYIHTGNNILDSVINYKIKSCKNKNIEFKYIITNNINKVNNTDVCILFSNLLDNAIEACENVENGKKYIELHISKVKSSIYILVKNSIAKSVLKLNPNFSTTKSDTQLHGMGIKSINNIIDKYNGIINYHEEENILNVEIILNI